MGNKIDINFDKEIKLLYEELNNTDNLYSEVKDHYDKLKSARSGGTLKFISDQTGNILNIRKNRIEIIKGIINLKKLQADLQIKEISLNKDESGGDNINAVASALYDILKNDKSKVNLSYLLNKSEEESNNKENNVDVDAKLEERLNEIKKKKEEQKKKEEIKEEKYKLVCDLNKNLYAVDENYNILPDIEIDKNIRIEIMEDEDKEYIAQDQYGNEIEVVEFED